MAAAAGMRNGNLLRAAGNSGGMGSQLQQSQVSHGGNRSSGLGSVVQQQLSGASTMVKPSTSGGKQ